MTLINAEYFSFDGVDVKEALEAKGFLFIINDTKGRGLMGQELNTASVSGVDGIRLLDVTFPEREIQIKYTLGADNLTSLREAESYLASLLVREQVKPLSFVDQKGSFGAILTGFDTDLETDKIQQGTITFTCPDPFRYKERVEIKAVKYVANIAQEIEVDSNYYTEAKIEVKLSTATKEVVLTLNEAVIKYESKDTLAVGTILVFDGEALECRVNGELKVLEVDGEYPIFKSNLNKLTINTASLLSITYREREI